MYFDILNQIDQDCLFQCRLGVTTYDISLGLSINSVKPLRDALFDFVTTEQER